MPQPNDLSRSLVALNQDDTLIAVVEMSRSSWLVAGIVPGIARHPLKKLAADEAALLGLLERWRGEATQAGRQITRIAVAFEAGRDGFWLARWLRARGIEAYQPVDEVLVQSERRSKRMFTTIRAGMALWATRTMMRASYAPLLVGIRTKNPQPLATASFGVPAPISRRISSPRLCPATWIR